MLLGQYAHIGLAAQISMPAFSIQITARLTFCVYINV